MWTSNHQTQALKLFFSKGGYLTSDEVTAAGLYRITLSRLLQTGAIVRLARGVYRLANLNELRPADAGATALLEVQLRFPAALPCLSSALYLHGLISRPESLQFAVPNNHRALPLEYLNLPLETYYFSTATYDSGLAIMNIRNRELITYCLEKTLVDLLRYAPKIGRDLYLKGLQRGLREHRLDRRKLSFYTKEPRILKTLAHDLELLDQYEND